MDSDDEREKVKELLQQCGDEAALELVTTESCLEAGLLARFQRLKEGGKDPHVPSRLAALSSSVMSPSQMASSSPKITSAASEVKKLLESMSDQVRLEKSTLSTHSSSSDKTFHSSEEEGFDFEVDKIVEWAKDAAALNSQQEEEENPVFVRKMSTACDPKKKKKAS